MKLLFSTCRILSSFGNFVSSPFQLSCNIAVDFCLHTSLRLGQKPLRQKTASWCFVQKSLALMSNLASSLTLVFLLLNVSPVKIWRGDQYVRRDILDQLDLLLCCVSDYVLMKQTFLHVKLCWRSYVATQLHIFGKRDNGLRYRIFTRSQNSCFDKQHSSSFTGRVDSHADAPFSWLITFKWVF